MDIELTFLLKFLHRATAWTCSVACRRRTVRRWTIPTKGASSSEWLPTSTRRLLCESESRTLVCLAWIANLFLYSELFTRDVQYCVLVFFTIMTCTSIVVIPSIEPGLDQELSMAKDNHVVKYFKVSEERGIKFHSNDFPFFSSPLLY